MMSASLVINHQNFEIIVNTQFALINFIISPHQKFLDPPLVSMFVMKKESKYNATGHEKLKTAVQITKAIVLLK